MIDRLEGRTFRTLLVVMEEKSISKAAEKLGYVQSTVTTQIRLLEEAFGRKLFDRLPRGVMPTEAGRIAAAYAQRFLQLGSELEAELRETGEPSGPVRLRVLESFGAAMLWESLQSFLSAYPNVELRLDTGFQSDTVEAVVSGQADLGLVPEDPDEAELSFEPLLADELVWIASPQAAETIGALGWEALKPLKVIGFGPRCLYTRHASERLAENGAGCRGMIEFASAEMIKRSVESGLGLAYLPRLNVAKELAEGKLAECAALGRQPIRYGLISLRRRELLRAAKLLREQLRSDFAGGRQDEVVIE
ncbi:LysR family transcriptional regulator [Paenibacillus solanacearum]|nr:LysR family transcriptional regulator [Paenibacillus solanacearum]